MEISIPSPLTSSNTSLNGEITGETALGTGRGGNRLSSRDFAFSSISTVFEAELKRDRLGVTLTIGTAGDGLEGRA
jgi:hypothetical protein